MRIVSHVARLSIVVLLLTFALPANAKDTWTQVRSKNFFLIGNAAEKDIRIVATKLEQFRETFRQLFPRIRLNDTINTNVVVFRDDSAYRPFKPKKANGKPDDGIAGYFQPGSDLNYITLSVGKDGGDPYGVIFHEYVHFLLEANFGKSDVPPWFNEGLAEYYQTFKIENDQKVTLGDIQPEHLALLQQNQLIPLKTFFNVDNYSLHRNGNHSRSVFYAQAWALIHYLIQGGKTEGLSNFLGAVMNGTDPEKAFTDSFLMDYAFMEKTLKDYVAQRKYRVWVVSFKNKLVFDSQMTATPLTDSDANAYLGDLLYHTNEHENAEPYLLQAIETNPNSEMANTTLGLIRMSQRKFDEAKKFLEKAIAVDSKNHIPHFTYAYILSRESMDEFGFVREYPPEAFAKMRDSLLKAIELDPTFAESYLLLSRIYLVNGTKLEEAVELLKKAAANQPGNLRNQMLLAQIYLRLEKFDDARAIATKLLKSADDDVVRSNAQLVLDNIETYENAKRFAAEQQKEIVGPEPNGPILVRRNGDKPVTAEDEERIKRQNENISLNRLIDYPEAGQAEAVGHIEKIACGKGEILFTFRTDSETITLSSKDFVSLKLDALVETADGVSMGCDADVKAIKVVAVYDVNKTAGAKSKGAVRTLTFVPEQFARMSANELKAARETIIIDDPPPITEAQKQDMEEQQRNMILERIRDSLQKPGPDETRVFGVIEKIECTADGMIFVVKSGDATLKLKARSPQFRSHTPDASGLRFGCGIKPPPVNAVIIFKGSILKAGELVSVDFVPPSFKLEQ